jgi:hypothetical protein
MTRLGRAIFLTLALGRAPAIAGGATRAVDLDHVKVVNSGSDTPSRLLEVSRRAEAGRGRLH